MEQEGLMYHHVGISVIKTIVILGEVSRMEKGQLLIGILWKQRQNFTMAIKLRA